MALSSKNIRLLSRCDQGGRPDGVQIMLHKGHLIVGHMFADGFSVIDVRDALHPKTVAFVAAPPNTRALHLQLHEHLLLVVNGPNVWAMQQYAKMQDYFGKPLTDSFQDRSASFASGIRVFDVKNPAEPREIAFLHLPGIGVHRIWWVGGRYAYASAHLDGFTDHILVVIDVSDPTHPALVGRWWLPGMWRGGGEEPAWPKGKRWALHHAIIAGNLAYGAWRDGGLTVHDVSDPTTPKLISHRLLSPPFAGGSHTPLPLPDRNLLVLADEATSVNCAAGTAYTWVFDVREPANPVSIATLPTPAEENFCAKGGKFGPHNLHENRRGSLQSSTLIFATYHNAGVRVFDISDAFAPRQVGYFVPPPPEQLIDTRPGSAKVIQSCDIYVAPDGVMYVTDTNAGLYILQYEGH